ncbi:chromosome 6 open reading frame 203 [Plakobranchus ocellatus]|uniref:Chromosome 6 open reading frame 203 n=1 Tax=Plakobranchus ocellatus TaxID=259542 RepID=A0AAV4AAX6_9GAST|nr:chromosome 6 open reading frame 203 [Plakobranchus ocellatus]
MRILRNLNFRQLIKNHRLFSSSSTKCCKGKTLKDEGKILNSYHSRRPVLSWFQTHCQLGQLSTCTQFTSFSPSPWKRTTDRWLISEHPLEINKSYFLQTVLALQQVRRKSRRRQGPAQTDSDSDSDEDDSLANDDFDAPAKFKVMKIHTPSMRTDAIVNSALDVARNRLEEIFYGPGLLLNGAKMLKKSIKMEEGDYVDLVMDRMEDQLKVKRVKVIKIYSGKTNTDKLNVKVRVWKAPFLVDKLDSSRKSS